jgi:DNA-binding response OmpR family regulator
VTLQLRPASITFVAAVPALCNGYVSHLRDQGYAVSLVSDVREAATQAAEHRPDLVFLDLGPSAQTGLKVLRDLKADPCLGGVALVLLASWDSLDDVQAGLELGACDYVIKAETTGWALGREIPRWAEIDTQLPARLQ